MKTEIANGVTSIKVKVSVTKYRKTSLSDMLPLILGVPKRLTNEK